MLLGRDWLLLLTLEFTLFCNSLTTQWIYLLVFLELLEKGLFPFCQKCKFLEFPFGAVKFLRQIGAFSPQTVVKVPILFFCFERFSNY